MNEVAYELMSKEQAKRIKEAAEALNAATDGASITAALKALSTLPKGDAARAMVAAAKKLPSLERRIEKNDRYVRLTFARAAISIVTSVLLGPEEGDAVEHFLEKRTHVKEPLPGDVWFVRRLIALKQERDALEKEGKLPDGYADRKRGKIPKP